MMESRFGHDFSRVRVHADSSAAASAAGHRALAFTSGYDIYFGQDEYQPGTKRGQRLLAHELAHVRQQEEGRRIRSGGRPREENVTHLEREADIVSHDVCRGEVIAPATPAPPSIQCAKESTAAPTSCGASEVFTELDLPWPVPNSYLRGSDVKEEKTWRAELAAARKDGCEAIGSFREVRLKWDLGNPKLGSYFGVFNLNKNDIKLDINPHVVYSGKTCCDCFSGTASWKFNVNVSRKVDKKTETGKTTTPITGTVAGKTCNGEKCCDIKQSFDVSLWLGDDSGEIDGAIKGTVDLDGATYAS